MRASAKVRALSPNLDKNSLIDLRAQHYKMRGHVPQALKPFLGHRVHNHQATIISFRKNLHVAPSYQLLPLSLARETFKNTCKCFGQKFTLQRFHDYHLYIKEAIVGPHFLCSNPSKCLSKCKPCTT